jgi:hypothetical protein
MKSTHKHCTIAILVPITVTHQLVSKLTRYTTSSSRFTWHKLVNEMEGNRVRLAHSAVAHVGDAGVASAAPSRRRRGRRVGRFGSRSESSGLRGTRRPTGVEAVGQSGTAAVPPPQHPTRTTTSPPVHRQSSTNTQGRRSRPSMARATGVSGVDRERGEPREMNQAGGRSRRGSEQNRKQGDQGIPRSSGGRWRRPWQRHTGNLA